MTIKIPFNDLKRQNDALADPLQQAANRVLRSGWYILGEEVRGFEEEFARFLGASHCVGVANGSDAIELALRAAGIGRGDEVIAAANAASYASNAILALGAVPRYADVHPESMTLSPAALAKAATPKCRAVIVTHLFGRLADMDAIKQESDKLDLIVIEDCAQAHGADRAGRSAGTFGQLGCYSFYPTKNLGAVGDGGAVVTADASLADKVRSLRQYGWSRKYRTETPGGRNSRLDEIQAAVLRAKLPHLREWNRRRREIARCYSDSFQTLDLKAPDIDDEHVAHLYVVRTKHRNALKEGLSRKGIATDIHYPVPDYRQPALRRWVPADFELPVTEECCRSVLSLPCYPEMRDAEVDSVISSVKEVLHEID